MAASLQSLDSLSQIGNVLQFLAGDPIHEPLRVGVGKIHPQARIEGDRLLLHLDGLAQHRGNVSALGQPYDFPSSSVEARSKELPFPCLGGQRRRDGLDEGLAEIIVLLHIHVSA